MFAASKTGRAVAAGAATDQYFKNTVLLLNDSGTNGAQNNTFIDSSTNNFTITRNGNATQGSVNPYEPTGYWSGNLNGSSQYLTAPANSAFSMTGDFTIEAWIWIDSTIVTSSPDNMKTVSIFSGYGATSGTAVFGILGSTSVAGTGIFVYQDSPSIYVNATTTVPLDSWVHIAFTRSGSTIYGFVNGTAFTLGTSSSTIISSSNPVAIGRNQNTTYYNYPKGFISNHRVVKGSAVYTSTFTPPTTPLTAVSGTSLLCLQNNRFIDNSSNNFTITATGSPPITSFSPFAPTASYSGATYGGTGYFDGTGDYVTVANNSGLQFSNGNFTIELWFYSTNLTGVHQFINTNIGVVSVDLSYAIITNGTACTYYLSSTGTTWNLASGVSVGTVTANVWNHLALVRNGTTVTPYLNGVAGTSTSVGTNALYNFASSLNIGVGGNNDYFAGYISNLRIVKGTAVYTASFTPPTAPVTAITNTQLLLNATNAGIYDATALNDMETVGNAQVSTTQYKWGASSMKFDGNADYLVNNGNTNSFAFGTGNFTIEFWMYPTNPALGFAQSIYDQRPTSTNGLYPTIYFDGSGNILYFTNSANRITGSTISANAWYHIALTRSGTSTKLFINGTQSGSTYTDSNNYINTSGRPWIGQFSDSTAPTTTYALTCFNGYIEDLRVTKGIARYTANFTAPTAAFPTR